jgi:hypothetical protein
LFRSTTGKSQDIHGEKDVLLAVKVAELYIFPLVAKQGEVWCNVTNFQRNFCKFRFLRLLCQWWSDRHEGKRNQQS